MTAQSKWTGAAFVAFFVACLLLGGSSQGIWPSLVLQLGACAILVFTLLQPPALRPLAHLRALNVLLGATIAYLVMQLIPLPPGVWSSLPGRELIVDGYRQTGTDLPWLPISVAPNASVASILAALPAIAVFAWLSRRDDVEPKWIGFAILGVTFAAVLLGILQRTDPSFQLYPVTNTGATGFFANSNHMGALLVVAVPFLVATAASMQSKREGNGKNSQWIWKVTAVLGAGFLVTGTVVNGSLAVLLLIVPIVFASLFLLVPTTKIRAGRVAASLGAIVAIIAVGAAWLISSGMRPGDQSSVTIRQDIWENTAKLATDHGLSGAGLGAFGRLYPSTENPNEVDWVYVNLAHNDYLQLLLELGIPGLILLIGFLAWWANAVFKVWSTSDRNLYAKAATIGSAALLFHSIVDYPLRTPALSVVFAACLAMMALSRQRMHSEAQVQGKHLRLEDL